MMNVTDIVTHWKWGRGEVLSVDSTSFQVDAHTPIVFVTVRFDAGDIYLPASDVEVLDIDALAQQETDRTAWEGRY